MMVVFRNVAITGIRVDAPLTHAGQSLPVCVTVRNFCGKPMTCTMTASCLGEPISGQELKLDALGKSEVTLLVPVKNALPLFGKVHLEVSDELAADNQAWFAANPTDLRRVYLQPDPASSGLDAWDYLRTIIAPTGGNPLAGVEMREDASEIETPGDTPRLLILRDGRKGKLPRRKAAMSFLEHGGAIICLWQDSREMREFLSYFDVSCALHGESATRRLKTVDFAHPVFRPFLDIKTAGLFDVLFFDPPTLQLPASARVSARFDNGDPAIAELDVAGGRLILIAAQMTREATDWPVRASFLPTWAQLLAYAGQTESQPASFECGLPIAAGCSIDHVTQMETSQAQDAGPAGFRPTRPGAYLLESAGRRQAVAVNLNECESSPLALAEDDDYEHRLCGEECDVAVAAMPVGIPTRGKNIWWLVIVIAGVFMTAEIVLANRTAL
ncbi:MAG: hypothetical protein GXY74_01540 [Phycisphaerae bacterium]|nr:hypothetical protein [Phycisphaerae bacterium]